MKLEVYSVFDAAVGAYLPPLFMRARSEAVRSFQDACRDNSHQFARNAKDYSLVHLGFWDDNSGQFESIQPDRVCLGTDFIEVGK